MVSSLVRKIVSKHERELRLMQRKLFTSDGDRPDLAVKRSPAEMLALSARLPRLQARALSNRRAQVSVLMDRGPALEMEPGSGVDPAWNMVTVSVKATNLLVGGSEMLDADEYVAWAQAAVGEQWANRLYTAGAMSGSGAGEKRLSTFYFYVFTDESGAAVFKPANWSLDLQEVSSS
ncbi:hypothetical protein HQQ81_20945 [Microbacteriaceae bacterium VKM Ac-2854]|nr:hypothetical protein [Microbacteriaceae bacterium VKM Ac-2854]